MVQRITQFGSRGYCFLALLSALLTAACSGNAFKEAADDSSKAPGSDASEESVEIVVRAPPTDGAAPRADGSVDGSIDATSLDATLLDGSTDGSGTVDSGKGGSDSSSDSPACGAGEKLCMAGCVSSADPTHGCGGEGCSPCSIPNATPACGDAGACAIGECNAGFADCNQNPTDGCETDVSAPANCGACANDCTTSAPYCVAGDGGFACGTKCAAGQELCGGSCVNLTNDQNHCGTCTTVCNDAGTGASNECVSSTCEVTCSTAGDTLCPGNDCYNLTNDPNHCGGCTTVCPALPNGTDDCVASACDPVCNSGYQLCGGACYLLDTVHGVFVSPMATATTNCGAVNAPCATIASGLAAAAKLSATVVYLDKGTYSENVTLPTGITLRGGWVYAGGGTWTKNCTSTAYTLAGIVPTSGDVAITANNVIATLDTLSIGSKTASSPGESLYGVVATNGANVTMTSVGVTIGPGGAGQNGTQPPQTSGEVTCTAFGNGKSGSDGLAGAPGGLGSFLSSGMFSPGPIGGTGGSGTPGFCGLLGGGEPATNVTCSDCSLDCCNPPDCAVRTCSCGTSKVTCVGQIGGLGTAGEPGSGATGGTGGGGSFGVVAFGATLTISGCTVQVSEGGTGGNGGAGGLGSSGRTGAQGSGSCFNATCARPEGPCTTPTTLTCGGAGGSPGGDGGSGGPGGGGAGGDSYDYVTGGGGTVTVTNSTLTPAAAAAPGGTNAYEVSGPSGAFGVHN